MRQGRILILLGLIVIHSFAGSASAMSVAPYTETQACVQDVDPAALSKGAMKAVGSVRDQRYLLKSGRQFQATTQLVSPARDTRIECGRGHADIHASWRETSLSCSG